MPKKNNTGANIKKPGSNVDLKEFLREIEIRAYEIYEKRIISNSGGNDFSDWLKAETEIKAKYRIN